jgi:hypothetical protein
MVASGKTLNFGTAGGELLRPRRASELLRRRSGVRRSGVSPQRAQGGKRGRCRQTGQTARSTSWVAVAPHVVLVVRAQPRLHRRDKRGAAAANRLEQPGHAQRRAAFGVDAVLVGAVRVRDAHHGRLHDVFEQPTAEHGEVRVVRADEHHVDEPRAALALPEDLGRDLVRLAVVEQAEEGRDVEAVRRHVERVCPTAAEGTG